MIWSISSFREFQTCERKWFLNEKLGSRSKKDVYRREIYFLSQLDSIDAWRGKIVDHTISEFIIPNIRMKKVNQYDTVIEYAKKLMTARYNFAIAQKHKEGNLKKKDHTYDYCALFDFEYNKEVNLKDKFRTTWEEIKLALNNFISNKDLIDYLKTASYLVTQRTLTYDLHGFYIKGIPDLIVFFKDKPPHIYDWKVHHEATKTYREQLLVYAVALTNCVEHKDFEQYIKGYKEKDVLLSEYQLITNSVRNYTVTDNYLERINDYVAGSLEKMSLKKCHHQYEELDIESFEKTLNINTCTTCHFNKICKEN